MDIRALFFKFNHMNIFNLKTEVIHEGGVMLTYKMDESELENYNSVLQDLQEHVSNLNYGTVLRIAVSPKIPIPVDASEPLYMYYPTGTNLETILEQMEVIQNQQWTIRNQESVLEDLMFGIVRQGNERIPYRLHCDTRLQFNIDMGRINVMVLSDSVDIILTKEWDGDPVSVLEQIEASLVTHGFNRGFGTTPTINSIRI